MELHLKYRDGYVYVVSHRSPNNIVYIKCRNNTCNATAKGHSVDENNFHILRPHADHCLQDPEAINVINFKRELKDALRRNWWPLRTLYDTFAEMYPEVAQIIPFNSMKTTLHKWRRAHFPPNPASIPEWSLRMLNLDPRTLDFQGGTLSHRLVEDIDHFNHLIIFDRELIVERMQVQPITKIFIDCTYKTRPTVPGCTQLLTILGIVENNAIPFLYAAMSRATAVAYGSVLQVFAQEVGGQDISIAMADYESALRLAMNDNFPNAHIVGCSVHFDRCIYRFIKSRGLTRYLAVNAEAKNFVQQVVCLAFLPHDRIIPTYRRLENNLSRRVSSRLRLFRNYFVRQWLVRVTPKGFSVYGLSHRSNNVVESHNSRLLRTIGETPSPWNFTEKIMRMMSKNRSDYINIMAGRRVSRIPRYTTNIRGNLLNRAWRLLYTGVINEEQFLSRVKVLKGNILPLIERISIENIPIEGDLLHFERQARDPEFDPVVVELPNHVELAQLRREEKGRAGEEEIIPDQESEDDDQDADSDEDGVIEQPHEHLLEQQPELQQAPPPQPPPQQVPNHLQLALQQPPQHEQEENLTARQRRRIARILRQQQQQQQEDLPFQPPPLPENRQPQSPRLRRRQRRQRMRQLREQHQALQNAQLPHPVHPPQQQQEQQEEQHQALQNAQLPLPVNPPQQQQEQQEEQHQALQNAQLPLPVNPPQQQQEQLQQQLQLLIHQQLQYNGFQQQQQQLLQQLIGQVQELRQQVGDRPAPQQQPQQQENEGEDIGQAPQQQPQQQEGEESEDEDFRNEDPQCKICFDGTARILFPCGHLCVCVDCLNHMYEHEGEYRIECPLCRRGLVRGYPIQVRLVGKRCGRCRSLHPDIVSLPCRHLGHCLNCQENPPLSALYYSRCHYCRGIQESFIKVFYDPM